MKTVSYTLKKIFFTVGELFLSVVITLLVLNIIKEIDEFFYAKKSLINNYANHITAKKLSPKQFGISCNSDRTRGLLHSNISLGEQLCSVLKTRENSLSILQPNPRVVLFLFQTRGLKTDMDKILRIYCLNESCKKPFGKQTTCILSFLPLKTKMN